MKEEKSLEYSPVKIKKEPPVESVLIVPRPKTSNWPAPKQEEGVKPKPKRVKSVQLTKFDAKWRSRSKLFQTFFFCFYCKFGLMSENFMNRHLKTCRKISPTKFECDCCIKRYLQKKHLRQHVHMHSSEGKYSCTKCGTVFSRKENFLKHSRSKKINKCANYEVEFSCKPLLFRHQREVHGNMFKCDECSYQTKVKHIFEAHKGTQQIDLVQDLHEEVRNL